MLSVTSIANLKYSDLENNEYSLTNKMLTF